MYHRIANVAYDPWGLCVSPERFREQLLALKTRRRVVAMDELVQALQAGRTPRRAIALTFDDGYADNFEAAKPILEELGVPATMFLTSGSIGSARAFWWDELAWLVLGCPGSASFDFQLGGIRLAARWNRQDVLPRDLAAWRIHDRTSDPRRLAYVRLWRALQPLPDAVRDQAMDRLRDTLEPAEGAQDGGAALPMSRRAACALASPLISLGGHGRTHVPLPHLSPEALVNEIVVSRSEVAELAGVVPPSGFAYPHGEWNAASRETVARAGYCWAVTTRSAKIDVRSHDLLSLPRVAVGNWSGLQLLLRLRLKGAPPRGLGVTARQARANA